MTSVAAAVGAIDPRYVAARRALLDALTELAPHGPAVIVAGAQAIYLRAGHGSVTIAPYTTDGDLAIDPALIVEDPRLDRAMAAARFELSVEPGVWERWEVVDGEKVRIPVDLIVPERAAPPGGRRGARLGVHGRRAARRAAGLEAALVDHSRMTIAALEPNDTRAIQAEVAGEAALLVAKMHKISDRLQSTRKDRVDDKDAADVVRLMQATAPAAIGDTLAGLREHPVACGACAEAIRLLESLFGRAGRPGVRMAVRALRLAMPEATVEALCVAYAQAVLDAVA